MEFIEAKSLVSNYIDDNPWFGINYNMNIYKGCCHGCIYCDSRSECYGIVDFDRVRAKKDSTLIIRRDLKSKKNKGVIQTGAMSDPYNPFEEKLLLTREGLKQINENGFGVSIITKSPLITRDIDILKQIKKHSPVLVKVTITTFDDELCKQIEPNVAVSSERFKAVKELSDNGIYTGILLMPVLPFINDTEENIKNIVKKAHESGAKFIFAYGMGLTLRGNQREYFYERLLKAFPENKNLVRSYIETYGNRYECSSPKSNQLWKIFKAECTKFNILYRMEDIIVGYRNGYEDKQISFFNN
ncbi:DNA repair photolyase [Clostridium cavendishii DSM 21758]|uniref:DNA repair photolyase n=1 Tax=Clostridium cavendishii DSM 21758 TaxID=1121302 RepID=A0A1M6CUK9_9CLOT|nr:DNA repair photolyase [Clostridium cavendishii DSM 21758]